MAIGRAQAKILHQAPAPLLQHAVERSPEAVAILRMEHVQPARGRPFQRPAPQPQQVLGLLTGEHLVGGNVPIPDQVAGAGERQRAALDVGDDRIGDAAGERVLHHREADQHDDQDQPAEQRRADDVVGDDAGDREARGEHPSQQQEPSRNQQHGAVEAVHRQIDDEGKSRDRDRSERDARDPGRRGGIIERERDQRAEEQQPTGGDMGVAHVPAIEVEVGEQEDQQGRRQNRLAAGAPHLLGARRQLEHLAPEAEVDADIGEHRPGERRRGREHQAALDHEQDGQEQRQEAGNAEDDAVVEREAVDLVLVGVRLPQIKLRQLFAAQLDHEGDHGSGIEGEAENIRGRAVLAVGTVAGRGRDGDDAREAEVRPDQAGADHTVVRRDEQPVDLLVAVVGEREHRPVVAALARAHLDPAHDPVGTRRGRDLDAFGLGPVPLDGVGQVDRGGVETHVDGVDGTRARYAEQAEKRQRQRNDGAQDRQTAASRLDGPELPAHEYRGRSPRARSATAVMPSARSCRYARSTPSRRARRPLRRAERCGISPA